MEHVFDENGIGYQMYDNSFIEISDIPKAQELADHFDSKILCRQLDFFAHKVNPYLDTIEKVFRQGYHWCVDQCEYATDDLIQSFWEKQSPVTANLRRAGGSNSK